MTQSSKAKGKAKKTCFVISPIGKDKTATRQRSHLILNYLIKPACRPLGLIVRRGDELHEPGIITTQTIQHLINDTVVIADLSERNPNVFYELAIRDAFRKPVVLLLDNEESLPFDVAGRRAVIVNIHDHDSTAEAKRKLTGNLRACLTPGFKVQSPVTAAAVIDSTLGRRRPELRRLADLIASVATLSTNVARLEKRIVGGDWPAWVSSGSTIESDLSETAWPPAEGEYRLREFLRRKQRRSRR
jgi:hypothetical protein